MCAVMCKNKREKTRQAKKKQHPQLHEDSASEVLRDYVT